MPTFLSGFHYPTIFESSQYDHSINIKLILFDLSSARTCESTGGGLMIPDDLSAVIS